MRAKSRRVIGFGRARRVLGCAVLVLAPALPLRADDRIPVDFQISQTTTFGQSVFVLGDLPELGANDLRFAVKLEPSGYPIWKATMSLPLGRSYSYRFYIRTDAAGQWGNPGNGSPIGSIANGATPPLTAPPASKTVFVHSSFSAPILFWRQDGGAFQSLAMHASGPGRAPAERRWTARAFGAARRATEFYLTDSTGALRDPPSGTYSSDLDRALVQDGNIFSYVPAPAVSAQSKAYNPASPPGINSVNLGGEFRRYRVLLPRGYAEHTTRRYPVLYMHDGQNVFEMGPFGTWNADETAESLTRAGQVREAILVGIDNTANRYNNYVTPDDGGQANVYVSFITNELKPLIDAQYRTLAGASDTLAMGSSLGGVVSLYMGWDWPGVFGKVGAMSGSWQLGAFPNRVQSQARRAIRLYLDSGDAGASNDNFWLTVGLRDNLINPARASGVGGACTIEGDIRHTYGPGHQHNEAAWAARLPGAFRYLLPAREDADGLAGVPSARPEDVNDDSAISIEDLYAFEQDAPGPESSLDVDRDGNSSTPADRAVLTDALRSAEPDGVAEP